MHSLPIMILATACLTGSCVDAFAGEVEKLPASGKAKFQVSYVQHDSHDLQLDDNFGFGTFELTGVTRNLEGKAWFDRMTEHCTGQYYWGEKNPADGNGSCLYLDTDGDKVMINWTNDGPSSGKKQIVGGTGKYTGLAGGGVYTTVELKTPVDGAMVYLVDVDLDFQLKQPTQ